MPKIDDEHQPRFVAAIPDLVNKGVFKNQATARLPMAGLFCHSDTVMRRNIKPKVTANPKVIDTAVGWQPASRLLHRKDGVPPWVLQA